MKHFRSEHAFQKYKPEESWKKKLSRFFRRKQKIISIAELPSHYKTNPYKAKNQTQPSKTKFKLTQLFVITLGWLFCLLYTPYFKIEKILYFNLGNTSKAELDAFIHNNYLNRKSWLPVNNYFFISRTKLAKDIKDHFSLENAEITKVFPSELNVEVQEKISAIVYDNGKKYFLLDKEGDVIKELAEVSATELKLKTGVSNFGQLTNSTTASTTIDTHASTTTTSTTSDQPTYEHTPNNEKIKQFFADYPIVYDRRNLDIVEKQKNILPPDFIENIIVWNKQLSQQGRLRPKYFAFDNLNSGTVIETAEPWYIIFQSDGNTDTQITVLQQLLTTVKPKEYIDLRFGEKIYWK